MYLQTRKAKIKMKPILPYRGIKKFLQLLRSIAKDSKEKPKLCTLKTHLLKVKERAGENAHHLRTLATLAENPNSLPSTHMVPHNLL